MKHKRYWRAFFPHTVPEQSKKLKLSDEIRVRVEHGQVLGDGTWIDEVAQLEEEVERARKLV